MSEPFLIGLVGARGHTGRELIRLIAGHPELMLAYAVSRELAGRPVTDVAPEDQDECIFEALTPEEVAKRRADVVILALPDGAGAPFVDAIERDAPHRIIIDLSADYRFDDDWAYGLPELHRDKLKGAKRIANPGCYATAMQLVVAPIRHLLAGTAHCVGISGYSGAGTKPGPNNDPERLKDNILPYALTGHIHEREVSHHMGCEIHFSPHVASFFRGINMTVQWQATEPVTATDLVALYNEAYQSAHYVKVLNEIPNIQQVVNTPNCIIGGFSVSDDGMRVSTISVLDNLAKGATSQAMQNINISLGLDETLGIDALYGSQ